MAEGLYLGPLLDQGEETGLIAEELEEEVRGSEDSCHRVEQRLDDALDLDPKGDPPWVTARGEEGDQSLGSQRWTAGPRHGCSQSTF